ncbi:MAG: c(7)-type cytochrome triheme domain-containing protein [Pseudomonadota bacterium]
MGAAVALLLSSAAVGASFPAVLRIPRRNPGVVYPPRALFSHRSHEAFGCYACHPSIFSQQNLVGFTHQEMNEGKFCARCHDGHAAFAIRGTACAGCHVDAR